MYVCMYVHCVNLNFTFTVATFGDKSMATAILKTHCRKTMKKFGQKVTPFDKVLWREKCRGIVKEGNLA